MIEEAYEGNRLNPFEFTLLSEEAKLERSKNYPTPCWRRSASQAEEILKPGPQNQVHNPAIHGGADKTY